MVQHHIERIQPNERLRGNLVNAIIWDICVSSANIHRSPQQKTKNAALFITLASYRATFSLFL